jgi:peptidyl-prolyl cis-trans isomerase C
MRTLAVCLIPLFFTSLGCSSTPALPDEPQSTAREYRSTDEAEQPALETPAEIQAPKGEDTATAGSALEAIGPVATVDGAAIEAETFNSEVQRSLSSGLPPELLRQMAPKLVQGLIDRHLIDRAVSQLEQPVNAEAIDAKIKEVESEFANNGMGTLEEAVARMNISVEELRSSVAQSIAIEDMLIQRGLHKPTPEETQTFYEGHTDQFTLPERVRAQHILLKVEADAPEATWREIQKKALTIASDASQANTDFGEIARNVSDCPSKDQGGDLGLFTRGKMVPEFEEVAFSLAVGEISEPTRTQFGWHIIKANEHPQAGVVPFDDVREKLETKMWQERVQGALTTFVEELRGAAKIEVFENNIR